MSHSRFNSPRLALSLVAAILLAPALLAQDFSHPDTVPAPQNVLIQKANDALAAGDFSAALKILTTLNTQTPNNPEVLYDLGLTLEALDPAALPADSAAPDQKAPSAESYYRQSIDANPLFPASHVALGLLLARNNRPAEARPELLAATTIPDADPGLKARAFRALARLDQISKPPNLAAASDELLAALKLTPEQPDDILLSAEIAEASPDLPTAEKAYRRFLALPEGAGDPQATAALAHILLVERHPSDAEALLTVAIAQHPGDPTFSAQLAQAYLASYPPKIGQAIALLEALHAKDPSNANITRVLARVYLETKHPDQADPLYAGLITAQAAHPDPTLLDDRAEALLQLHRPAEAEKLLKQAVANPSAFPSPAAFADAATHLAFAASEIDDPRMTLQALTLRATVQQPSPSSLFLEATANDALHQTSKAVEIYKQFLAAAGGNFPDQESQARKRITELQHAK
jgi:Tfp pilus assembly protein PilF